MKNRNQIISVAKKTIDTESKAIKNLIELIDDSFADAIENQTTPIVSLENGTKALEVANMIIDSYSS